MTTVLAIDPGREKCGLAVVSEDGVLHREVVTRDSFMPTVAALSTRYSPGVILVGGGTGSGDVIRDLSGSSVEIPVEVVDETLSSLRARRRFFQENPPKGLRRLIPRGLLTPVRPYDDYVAVILAEDYLKGRSESRR